LAKVVALTPDLMLGSRIEAGLGAAGHEITVVASLSQAPIAGAELVVADLDSEPPEALAALGLPVLGYYRHTSPEVRARAEAAGVDLVVPRSRLARELPELAAGLLSRTR
jgi:hypothetical protein